MINRFSKPSRIVSEAAVWLFLLVTMVLTPLAFAAAVPVVATSVRAVANGFNGYNNKVVVDPFGNVFTVDSSNGRLWEIPAGAASPKQIFLQFSTSAIAATYPVTAVQITNQGSGYTTAPTVTFSAPPSPCKVAVCTQATGTATISSAGQVTVVTITAGAGYTSGAPTVTFSAPPAGGTTAVGVATLIPVAGLSSTHGLAVDQYGDVFVSSGTNGNLYFLKNTNGVLCTTCNAAGTGPLDLTGAYGFSTLDDYYVVVADAAVDNSGNVYVAVSHCNNSGANACGKSEDSIFLMTGITNATTATTIAAAGTTNLYIGALPGGKAVLNMAVDNNGHLFYVDGTNAYVVNTTAGTPTPVTIGSFTAPSGVSVDGAGDLFIVDNNKKLLYEIPNENGTLNAADQFVVASVTNGYYSSGFDLAGTIYISDGSDKVVNAITIGGLNVGTSAVGAAATGTMNFFFNTAETPASFSLVQGPGAATEFARTTASTCVAGTAYAALGSCTMTVAFTPSTTGLRQGGIVVGGAGNKAIVTGLLSGTGTGPALTVDPATQTSLSGTTAWGTPSAVAMDGAGDVYVADASANTVQVFSAGGTSIAAVGSGLSKPGGVAVDGAGNVYVADTGNSRIVEIPNEGGTLNTADQTVVVGSSTTISGTTMLAPSGIAVDPNGGIYIADTGRKRVLRYTPFNGGFATVGSGFQLPVAVAVDNNGNSYVSDETGNQVYLVKLVTSTQTIAVNGLSAPTSIGLDASGSLYVVNSGTSSVLRIPSVAGTLTLSAALNMSSSLTTPTGVAANGAGNVAIADSGVPGAFSLVRTNGTVNFGNVNLGLSSSAQAVTLTSAGSAAVTLNTPSYNASGSGAPDYSVTIPSGGGCTGGLSLTIGVSCSYSAVLTPLVGSGTLAETLTFSSNAVNAGSLTSLLTGVATNLSLTNTVLSLTTSANPVYGQAVTALATVTSQRAGVVPTGKVTFTLNGTTGGKVNLATAAPYTASYTFAGLQLPAGSNVINASYGGDANNAASNATAPLIIAVAKQPATAAVIASTVTASGPANVMVTQLIQVPGSTYYFDVTVSPTILGTPSGTVNLVLAGTTSPVLATATLSSTGWAQLTYTTSATAAVGTYQYQVVYAGDSNFIGTTSNTATIQLAAESYVLSLPTTSYTVMAGSSVVVPITVTGIGGYTGNVTVGYQQLLPPVTTAPCAGLPVNAVCVFSPGIVALTNGNYPSTNPSGVFNLTINTSQAPATPYPAGLIWPGCVLGLLALMLAARRRGTRRVSLLVWALAVALSGAALGTSGCGKGNGFTTPAGSSTVTVEFSGTPISGYPTTPTTPPTNPPNIPNSTSFQLTVH